MARAARSPAAPRPVRCLRPHPHTRRCARDRSAWRPGAGSCDGCGVPSRWGPARTPPLRAQRPERHVDGEPACARSGGPPSSPPSSTATVCRSIGAIGERRRQRWGRGRGRPHRAEARPSSTVFLRAEHDVGWAARGPHRARRRKLRGTSGAAARPFDGCGVALTMGPARTPPLRAQRPERRVDGEPLACEAGAPHPRPIVIRDGVGTHPFDRRRGTRARGALTRTGDRSARSASGGVSGGGAARAPASRGGPCRNSATRARQTRRAASRTAIARTRPREERLPC